MGDVPAVLACTNCFLLLLMLPAPQPWAVEFLSPARGAIEGNRKHPLAKAHGAQPQAT